MHWAKVLGVVQCTGPRFRGSDVTGFSGETHTHVLPGEGGIKETHKKRESCAQRMKKVHLIISDYIKYFADKKSRRTIYYQAKSGRFPLPVFTYEIRGRKHYFVEIADPVMMKIVKIREKKNKNENVISIDVRVPEKIVKPLNLISSPDCYDYKLFHKFIEETMMKGGLNSVSTTIQFEPVGYEKKHIQMMGKDYRRLKHIAESSHLKISKTLTILLEAYLMLNYPNNFLYKSKGGQNGDMLFTC